METQSYNIRVGKFSDHYLDIENVFKEHWDESARNKSLMILKPDYESYLSLEQMGKLLAVYAYCGDQVVGYSYNFINRHIHYSDLLVSHNDVLFILPDHRNGSVGLKLIKETEKQSKLLGAKLMLWHAKENTSLSKILPRMKCNVQEIIFSKEL